MIPYKSHYNAFYIRNDERCRVPVSAHAASLYYVEHIYDHWIDFSTILYYLANLNEGRIFLVDMRDLSNTPFAKV